MSQLVTSTPSSAAGATAALSVSHFAYGLRPWLGVLLSCLSLGLGVFWAFSVKPLFTPDEPAHLQAVMEIRNRHVLPEVHYNLGVPGGEVIGTPGDKSVRDYAWSVGFRGSFKFIPYESTQPPLYYLAAGLLADMVSPDPQTVLYLSRLLSALLGAGTVYFCWASVLVLKPTAYTWAALSAGTVAMLPQFCFNSVSVSNDSMINFTGAALFYVLLRSLRSPNFDTMMLISGASFSLAVLAKLSATAFMPGLALVILFRSRQTAQRDWGLAVRNAVRFTAGFSISALIVCGWWLVRNLLVYGEISGTSETFRFYRERLGQPPNLGSFHILTQFLQTTWESFWGTFGWMELPLPDVLYQQAFLVSLVATALTLVAVIRPFLVRSPISTHMLQAACISVSIVGTLVVSYLIFNSTVGYQPQARYLFPVLVPWSMFFTYGIYKLVSGRLLRPFVIIAVICWLASLNALGLTLVRAV